jgi:acetyl esterase/lipase
MIISFSRRGFLNRSAAGAAALALPALAGADERPKAKEAADDASKEIKTFIYKTVGDCAIRADVYGAAPGERRPVVVNIHGGALIMGGRGSVFRPIRDGSLRAGHIVVSIDYRLAPETKIPAIFEDVSDALRWVRESGPKLFGADPQRVAVTGGSAGGYLTLATGYIIRPRPKALVSFFGYGDILAPWLTRPSPFFRRMKLVSKGDAEKAVGRRMISEQPSGDNRARFFVYCRQNGLWTKLLSGIDPYTDPKALEPLCPLRNVSEGYPPTFLVHGTDDNDVPCEQSEQMDKELTRRGIEHELIIVPGAGHGLGGGDPTKLAQINERVLAFLDRHLR